MAVLSVYKRRETVLPVNLGVDVSDDEIVSEIREKANSTSSLIASWDVSFQTDGQDGHCIFVIDDSAGEGIAIDTDPPIAVTQTYSGISAVGIQLGFTFTVEDQTATNEHSYAYMT